VGWCWGGGGLVFVVGGVGGLGVFCIFLLFLCFALVFFFFGGGVGSVLRKMKVGAGDELGFDLVFLDPPYDAAAEYDATLGLLGGAGVTLLAEGAVVIAEHRKKERLEERYGVLERTRLLEQGDAALSFYARGAGD